LWNRRIAELASDPELSKEIGSLRKRRNESMDAGHPSGILDPPRSGVLDYETHRGACTVRDSRSPLENGLSLV